MTNRMGKRTQIFSHPLIIPVMFQNTLYELQAPRP